MSKFRKKSPGPVFVRKRSVDDMDKPRSRSPLVSRHVPEEFESEDDSEDGFPDLSHSVSDLRSQSTRALADSPSSDSRLTSRLASSSRSQLHLLEDTKRVSSGYGLDIPPALVATKSTPTTPTAPVRTRSQRSSMRVSVTGDRDFRGHRMRSHRRVLSTTPLSQPRLLTGTSAPIEYMRSATPTPSSGHSAYAPLRRISATSSHSSTSSTGFPSSSLRSADSFPVIGDSTSEFVEQTLEKYAAAKRSVEQLRKKCAALQRSKKELESMAAAVIAEIDKSKAKEDRNRKSIAELTAKLKREREQRKNEKEKLRQKSEALKKEVEKLRLEHDSCESALAEKMRQVSGRFEAALTDRMHASNLQLVKAQQKCTLLETQMEGLLKENKLKDEKIADLESRIEKLTRMYLEMKDVQLLIEKKNAEIEVWSNRCELMKRQLILERFMNCSPLNDMSISSTTRALTTCCKHVSSSALSDTMSVGSVESASVCGSTKMDICSKNSSSTNNKTHSSILSEDECVTIWQMLDSYLATCTVSKEAIVEADDAFMFSDCELVSEHAFESEEDDGELFTSMTEFLKEQEAFAKDSSESREDSSESAETVGVEGGDESTTACDCGEDESDEELTLKFADKIELLYRASYHGFTAEAFHRHCDAMGSTLVVIESTLGHVSGGFTTVPWNSPPPVASRGFSFQAKADPNAMIFCVRIGEETQKKYSRVVSGVCPEFPPFVAKLKAGAEHLENAVGHKATWGPLFGGGDIFIYDNCDQNDSSHSEFGSGDYDAMSCFGADFLFGAPQFRVKDIEVYKVFHSQI